MRPNALKWFGRKMSINKLFFDCLTDVVFLVIGLFASPDHLIHITTYDY